MSQPENRKYVSFSHTFSDPWSGENATGISEDAQDVTLTFRFAKPTKTQIQRLQDKAAKNAGQASRNLILDCVHPDDKQALTDAMEEYPGIATSFAAAIIKGVAFPPNWETSPAGARTFRPGRFRAGGRAHPALAALRPVGGF